eukprot:5485713-Prymnesium_polylepis.1
MEGSGGVRTCESHKWPRHPQSGRGAQTGRSHRRGAPPSTPRTCVQWRSLLLSTSRRTWQPAAKEG